MPPYTLNYKHNLGEIKEKLNGHIENNRYRCETCETFFKYTVWDKIQYKQYDKILFEKLILVFL